MTTEQLSVSPKTEYKITQSVQQAEEELDITDTTVNEIYKLYKTVYDKDLYHWGEFETLLGAIIYIATRASDADTDTYPPQQIAEVMEVERNSLLRASRHLQKELTMEDILVSPEGYISKYCNELDATDEVENIALEIAEASEDLLKSGRSPSGFAASAVYSASRETGAEITQEDVSEVSNRSPVTIRNCYREQLEMYNDDS